MTEVVATNEAGIVTRHSPRTVAGTVARLAELVTAKGAKVFDVIDQAEQARQAGLDLRETVLVIFGNPAAGTAVMAAEPLAALDLPLKILVWDDAGQTNVSYYPAATLAVRHGLDAGLAARLTIDPLVEALVAP
jgi:uncharacterized protein (DUF302 family)